MGSDSTIPQSSGWSCLCESFVSRLPSTPWLLLFVRLDTKTQSAKKSRVTPRLCSAVGFTALLPVELRPALFIHPTVHEKTLKCLVYFTPVSGLAVPVSAAALSPARRRSALLPQRCQRHPRRDLSRSRCKVQSIALGIGFRAPYLSGPLAILPIERRQVAGSCTIRPPHRTPTPTVSSQAEARRSTFEPTISRGTKSLVRKTPDLQAPFEQRRAIMDAKRQERERLRQAARVGGCKMGKSLNQMAGGEGVAFKAEVVNKSGERGNFEHHPSTPFSSPPPPARGCASLPVPTRPGWII